MSVHCHSNTPLSGGTAAIPLCASLLCVKDGESGGRWCECTTEISVQLLSHRSKGNVKGGKKTIPSSFNYIPLIKVQKRGTHHMWS